MTNGDRERERKRVQRAVRKLVRKGWRCTSFVTQLNDDEPYTITLTLTIEDSDSERGVC
jgi:hypothetical protein